MRKTPTPREVLAGYKQFNAWEVAEQKKILPQLTIEGGLAQFFELCALARVLARKQSGLVQVRRMIKAYFIFSILLILIKENVL